MIKRKKTHSRGLMTVYGGCATSFAYRTDGYDGGDGGRLEIDIKDSGGTYFAIAVDDQPEQDCSKITLQFYGDIEMSNAIRGLEFLVKELRAALGPDTQGAGVETVRATVPEGEPPRIEMGPLLRDIDMA
jgi:hypothetical protein